MRASLDTNVIIHFYKAGRQQILFDFFEEGLFIYEQIRNVELENHGKGILDVVDKDIKLGRIEIYSDDKLRDLGVYRIFYNIVNDNKMLYGTGDLGEVYAISLAQTLGCYSLVTDDIKQGGPYMSLLQFDDDIMPFTFADVLILRYLSGEVTAEQTIEDFDDIDSCSEMNWSFESQIKKFIRRFWTDPYRKEDNVWIKKYADENSIRIKTKLAELSSAIKREKQ